MDIETRRLRWKCRRGLLELDLVLQRFLESNSRLQEEDLRRLHALLDLPDNDLWDVICGRSEDYAAHLNEVVARLRAV